MDEAALLAELRRETAAIAAIQPRDLQASVPSCPGWTVADVVAHTGWIHRFVTKTIEAQPEGQVRREDVASGPEDPGLLLAWFAEGAEALADRLEALDPDHPVETWRGRQPGRFLIRRMAQETAVHRWDAASGSDSPRPVAADLAADGIEEIFEVYVPGRFDFEAFGGAGETIHLHAVDVGTEWLLTIDGDRLSWRRDRGKGEASVSGDASDVLLLLWSRLPPARLDVSGDSGLLDRWQAAASF